MPAALQGIHHAWGRPGGRKGGPVLQGIGQSLPGEEYRGQAVALVGCGVSNLAVARLLLSRGARVTICDRQERDALGESFKTLAGEPVAWRLGPDYLEGLARERPGQPFHTIFLTPGMRKDLPALAEARSAGVLFNTEIGLFLRHCPAPVTGITGSAGKTTTTSLVGHILGRTGRPVFVGGNIGQPLLERLPEMSPDALVVLELSSFQLQLLHQSPQVAVALNLRPNHLDIHASFDEYAWSKENIIRHQRPGDWAVLNADDPLVAAWAPAGERVFFSLMTRPERGAYLEDGRLMARGLHGDGQVAFGPVSEIPLLGRHNVANVLAALAATARWGLAPDAAWSAVRSFHGVEHRLELVGEARGVHYYNDSIATAPDRTEAALQALEGPLVLIAGGYDKKIPFDGLGEAIAGRVDVLVLLGTTAPRIRAAVEAASRGRGHTTPAILEARGLEEAVALASSRAVPGGSVLLSPASASYDMFRNYQERGQRFKQIVRGLIDRLDKPD